jgi:hypothetical protein
MKNTRCLFVFLFLILISFPAFSQPDSPDLTSPANGILNYNYSKVTYSWTVVPDVNSYDLQVCKTDSFKAADGVKTYSNISGASYTPPDFLDYNTKYYWRVRAKQASLYSDYSAPFEFTTGSPSSGIETADVKILLRHTEGRITEITYKHGSNLQLLDTTINTKNKIGLGRVSNEVSTKLVSWVENAGDYTYTYENAIYGSKSLNIQYDADSIIVKLQINLTANKAAATGSAWKPGGDIGPLNDNILYSSPSDAAVKRTLIYPVTGTNIFSGYTNLVAVTDNRFDERFGFFAGDSVSTTLTEDVSFTSSFSFPATSSAQVKYLYFAISSKAGFYSWNNKKYVIVNNPSAGIKLKNQDAPGIEWETYGLSGNLNIALSVNGGTSFPYSLAANTANDGIQAVTLPDLSGSVPLNNCIISVSGSGITGYSGVFSIISGQSSVFTISDNLTGSPTDKISVPILITPASGDSINAVDIRLYYSKDHLTYNSYTVDPDLASKTWLDGVTNNSTYGYLQIGALKKETGSAITAADTLLTVNFTIKPTTRVGLQIPLKINNTYLSAADNNAQKLQVLGEDGLLTVYSRISGNLIYIVSKKPVVGDSLIRFITVNTSGVDVDTIYSKTNSAGMYDFSNKIPGITVRVEPAGDLAYPASIAASVDATDARLAFDGRDGGSTMLPELQKIAADVNNDGIVSSIDALAILKISTEELTISDFGVKNWVFVDSTYKLTSANWGAAPKNKVYFPLDSVKAKQSFWGAIRGDVDGKGYYNPSLGKVVSTEMITSEPGVTYSVPSVMNALPGDTVYIPLSLKLNGKLVGAFNASLILDNNLLIYTGHYTEGNIIPQANGWIVSTHFNEGKLNIGATDFSGTLDPINQDGNIAVFEFIVNENAGLGDSCELNLSFVSASDSKLNVLPVNSSHGTFTVSFPASTNNSNNIIYEYKLEQNYPNPFNPATIISYSLAKESKVIVEVFNAIGEKVASLADGVQPAGRYNVSWNAAGFASGIYFYRIKAGEFVQTRKMMLLK